MGIRARSVGPDRCLQLFAQGGAPFAGMLVPNSGMCRAYGLGWANKPPLCGASRWIRGISVCAGAMFLSVASPWFCRAVASWHTLGESSGERMLRRT